MSDIIAIHLDSDGPTAAWAARTARALVTSRMHLATSGESDLLDDLIRKVANEIFADVSATPEVAKAAERALALVAAMVQLAIQLLDGWAHADEVGHEEVLSSLFQLLEREGITF
jgi:hypothetical protein